jgi:hypothetical protein
MRMKFIIIILILLGDPGIQTETSCRLKRKEKKEIHSTFGTDSALEAVKIPEELASNQELYRNDDCLYIIYVDGDVQGYLLSTSAMGRFDFFDYSMIFSDELSVLEVMVTVYRSTHGIAICQRRWLNQFKGYSGEELELGRDIDAVSGATLSARSIVADVQRSHNLMTFLTERKLIP